VTEGSSLATYSREHPSLPWAVIILRVLTFVLTVIALSRSKPQMTVTQLITLSVDGGGSLTRGRTTTANPRNPFEASYCRGHIVSPVLSPRSPVLTPFYLLLSAGQWTESETTLGTINRYSGVFGLWQCQFFGTFGPLVYEATTDTATW
jgi:hypothetical protein